MCRIFMWKRRVKFPNVICVFVGFHPVFILRGSCWIKLIFFRVIVSLPTEIPFVIANISPIFSHWREIHEVERNQRLNPLLCDCASNAGRSRVFSFSWPPRLTRDAVASSHVFWRPWRPFVQLVHLMNMQVQFAAGLLPLSSIPETTSTLWNRLKVSSHEKSFLKQEILLIPITLFR